MTEALGLEALGLEGTISGRRRTESGQKSLEEYVASPSLSRVAARTPRRQTAAGNKYLGQPKSLHWRDIEAAGGTVNPIDAPDRPQQTEIQSGRKTAGAEQVPAFSINLRQSCIGAGFRNMTVSRPAESEPDQPATLHRVMQVAVAEGLRRHYRPPKKMSHELLVLLMQINERSRVRARRKARAALVAATGAFRPVS